MKYVALDFETGNASPLSACALGASIFEDDVLVREQVSVSYTHLDKDERVLPMIPAGGTIDDLVAD